MSLPARRPPVAAWRTPLDHLLAMGGDTIGFQRAMVERYGRVVELRLGPVPGVLVADADVLEHVLVGARETYDKSTRGWEKLRLFLGDGLLTAEGDRWRQGRRIVQPAFHRRSLEGLVDTMAEVALETADAWAPLARSGASIDMAEAMMRFALRVASRTFFGLDLGPEAARIGESMAICQERFERWTTAPYPWPERWPTARNRAYAKAAGHLDGVVRRIIADRRRDPAPHADLLGLLMAAEDPETGARMGDQQLRDEVLTMLLAGHETTANALAWTFHLLAEHPAAAEAIACEVESVLGRVEAPGAADLGRLEVLDALFSESLRLFPPAWLSARRAVADDVAAGYRIRRGSFVFLAYHLVHRHPDYWDRPDAFDPDRFRPAAVEARRAAGQPKLAFAPFGAGQRKCIGDRFAQMEALVALAVWVRRFRVRSVPGHPVALEPSITLRPRHGLQMTLEERR